MTDHEDYGQPWPPQQGYGQQYPQDQPWQPQPYDPGAHHQRIGGQQHAPQGQPWSQGGASHPPSQPPYAGYQPPQAPPGWQQPGYGQPPPYQPQYAPGPSRPPRRHKRHTARNVLAALGGLVVVIIAIAVAESGHGTGSTQLGQTPAATQAAQPASASAAASSAPAAKQTVTYVVSGSSADVTYGPAGSDLSGSVPMRVTQPLGTPVYYAISAQLQGSGDVSCQILVDGKVISSATASGGYNIADCEISQDPLSGNWQDTNQGA
jgi:hypothetical protein